MAEWLDNIHRCNFATAWAGFEIMMACCRSAVEGGEIDLPLASGGNELEMLKSALPQRSVRLSMPQNAKEYVRVSRKVSRHRRH